MSGDVAGIMALGSNMGYIETLTHQFPVIKIIILLVFFLLLVM